MQNRMTEKMEQEKAEFYRNLLKLIEDWEEKNKVWITGIDYNKSASEQEFRIDLSLILP